jgi:alpha/beta superfamily hydrolase
MIDTAARGPDLDAGEGPPLVRDASGVYGRAVTFGPSSAPLFGFYHAPRGAERRDVGILLCPPLGFEAMSAYRFYRHLAERLASAGMHVLRFDYLHTGDSAGQRDGPERLQEVLDAGRLAIAKLKECAGTDAVALFGSRFGAIVASLLASERDDVASLVLFAAPLNGRAYARELVAMHRLNRDSRPDEIRLVGFLVSDALVQDLKGVDLLQLVPKTKIPVLMVPRDDAAGEERIAQHLRGSGNSVDLVPTPGYAAMSGELELSTLPTKVLDTIDSWMREHHRSAAAREFEPKPLPSSWTIPTRDGGTVEEHAVRFGPDRRLFGIVTAPSTRPGASSSRASREATLFLNVGANYRIGAGRQYVALARELAMRGITSLRFDASGLGESHAADGRPENEIYTRTRIADVKAAMDFLEAHWDVHRFMAVGVCSGAYLAFHSAAADARIYKQILVNLSIFEWTEGESYSSRARVRFRGTESYGRSLLKMDTWKRVFNGQVAVADIAKHLLAAGNRLALATAREALIDLGFGAALLNDIERDFLAISRRGARTLMVYSADDAALDTLAHYLGPRARRMRKRPTFHLRVVLGADHSFVQPPAREELTRLVLTFAADSA